MKIKDVFFIILCCCISNARALTITSFNIKLYGQKTSSGQPTQSERNKAIKEFLDKEVPKSDVFIFEEIMDKTALMKSIVPDHQCVSYDNSMKEHQYVVLCAKKPYQLLLDEEHDDNFALEAVALGSLGQRPAVHALLADKNGQVLVRIIGVHLSAFPARTTTRLEQMAIIGTHLSATDHKIPTVITGDFNTYPAALTGHAKADWDLISETLKTEISTISMANHPSAFTFRTPEFRSKFDHFWLSKNIKASPVQVTGQCNSAAEDESDEVMNYYRLISDHCPVTLQIDL